MLVSQYMTKAPECVTPNQNLRHVAKLMDKENVGFLPVCDRGGLVGILTDRDLVVRAVAEGVSPDQVRVREVMSRNPAYCYEDDELWEAARIMEQRKVRRVVVLDRLEEIRGVLSLADFTKEQEGRRLVAQVLTAVGARHAQPR